MDTEQLLIDVRNTVLAQLRPLSAFGVYAIGFNPSRVQDRESGNGKFGMNFVIYAGSELYTHLNKRGNHCVYPERLLLIYRTLAEVLKPFTDSGRLHFMANEAMLMATLPEFMWESAGVVLDDDLVRVPQSNIWDIWDRALAEGWLADRTNSELDPWGRVLNNAPLFTAENPDHNAWASFSVLPYDSKEPRTEEAMGMAALTHIGWNFLGETEPHELQEIAEKLLSDSVFLRQHNCWVFL
ncbi:MAG TPA: hypothetical protein VFO38_05815 [Candidatus Saccharimonadales bacterium]|nr:hypothetical protein [Candidatus Saccharimonadales bacterium]